MITRNREEKVISKILKNKNSRILKASKEIFSDCKLKEKIRDFQLVVRYFYDLENRKGFYRYELILYFKYLDEEAERKIKDIAYWNYLHIWIRSDENEIILEEC
ncbi:MAG: hypothetical protein QXG18_02795 [Candidatus Pacearchaeota archaeon]